MGFVLQHKQIYDQAQKHFSLAAYQPNSSVVSYEALYQIGRNAVFSQLFIDEGISALQEYIRQEISDDLPSIEWAYYRLSQLYKMKLDVANESIYRTLAAKTNDKDLIEALGM